MRNKTGIIILTIILTALCLFFISFSVVDRFVKKDATEFATNQTGQVDFLKKQQYLDSVYNKPVYNFLGLKEYTYKEVKQNGLNLGLDLQGGMHVTLEVSPIEILKGLSGNSADPNLKQALEMATNMQKNSTDNFTKLFYQAYKEVAPDKTLANAFANYGNRDYITKSSSDQEVKSYIEKEVDQAIDRTFLIVRARIDKFGVTSPNIQRIQGTGRIQVELPGADNPERIRNLLQGVAKLEFLEVYQANEFYPIIFAINDYLVSKQKAEKSRKTEQVSKPETQSEPESEEIDPLTGEKITKTAQSDTTALAADTTQEDVSPFITLALGQNLQQLGQLVYPVGDTAKINAILNDPRVKAIIPSSMSLFWEKAGDKKTELELVPVKRGRLGKAPLTGEVITDAKADFASSGGGYEISMSMNGSGAKAWRDLTRKAVETSTPQSRNRIAISLDNTIYSAPFVNEEIPNGVSSISGNFTEEEAKDLANVLKAGKLPAPAKIVEEGIIGPSLGQEAISQGIKSSIGGLVLVVVFMILYYSMGGMIANLALVFNIFFIIGILAQLHAALTLSGIAGIVLTMGMAVDANVLIFERIREELRNGKSIVQAIKEGYDKAFSSIFDSNITTILVGIILAWLGTGPVQGFATVLIIGIATSFFTSVFISRIIVEYMVSKKVITEKSFETVITRSFTKNVNFDFISFRRKSYIISSIIIAIGFACIFTNGLNMGVDFKGGRSYIVQFDQAIPASDVKSALSDVFENEGLEAKTYGENTTLKITTSYMIEDESTAADDKILALLNSGLESFSTSNPKVIGSEKVGATIANDMINTSLIAVILSLIGIFTYVFIRFKKWQFGLGAIVALTHDILIAIAIYGIATILGFSFEVDQIFIAAILTVIGYSVNNTVVVCDRIREKTALSPKDSLGDVINRSINDTLSRTIVTSLTILIVVVTLLIFGGDVLRGFSLILIIGATFGTYSSVFIATPIVLDLGKIEPKKS